MIRRLSYTVSEGINLALDLEDESIGERGE